MLGAISKGIITFFVVTSLFCVTLAQSLLEYRRQVAHLIRDYQWTEALRLAEDGLDRYPKDPQLLVAAAALMLQTGRPAAGEKLIESAITAAVSDPDLLGVMAELKWSQGALTGATYLFREALFHAPESPQLHHRLARVLFARGEEAEALEHAARAVAIDQNRTEYRRFFAALLEQAGRSQEAYEQLRLARLCSPGDAGLLLRLADTVKRSGQLSQALEYLEMATTIDPENPLYLRELSRLYARLGAIEQAEEARDRADRLETAFQKYAIAVGFASRGADAEAVAILESEVSENPEFLTGAALLADLYRKVGENEKALSVYRRILERDPGQARAREETAWLYVDRGELGRAVEILQKNDPEDVNQALLEGYRKLVRADWEGALTEFRQAERRYPLNPGILQQISLCLNSMGRPAEALAYLEKAHRVQPQNTAIDHAARMVRFEYGLELEKEGRWSQALDIFERLRGEDDQVADYLFHEAYCQQHLWDYQQAIELYRQGLTLDPHAAWARINLAACYYALALYDEAAEQWDVLVEESGSPEYVYNLGLARIRQWRLEEGWKLISQAAAAGFEPARQLQRVWKR